MTLLALMFHRATAGRHGNTAEMLDAHFSAIASDCHCVLPGEPLRRDKLNVCITFDDGHFDFFAVVYPLLAKHRLRALLAVPIAMVRERIVLPRAVRLQASEQRLPDGDLNGAYCTWGEIAEMAASRTVSIAAHGFTHRRLDDAGADLHTEIVVPQTMLAARTGQRIESLVLPYGRFSPATLKLARAHYPYVFRIGSADNVDWGGPVLYRIDADEMTSPRDLFASDRLRRYRWRRRWNRWRGR